LDDFLYLASPQGGFDLIEPGHAFRFSECFSHGMEALTGMIPIHNLDSIGKIVFDNLPNPCHCIANKDRFCGLIHARM
jgi:hypothetical protein